MKRRAIGDYARSAQPRSTLDMRHWWVQVGEESPEHGQPATGDLRLRDQASHGCRVRLWNLTTRNPPSNPRAPPVWDRKCPVPVREPGAHACRRPDRTDGTGAPMPEAEPVSYCRVVNTVRRAVTRTCRVQVAAHVAVACPGRRSTLGRCRGCGRSRSPNTVQGSDSLPGWTVRLLCVPPARGWPVPLSREGSAYRQSSGCACWLGRGCRRAPRGVGPGAAD